MAKKVFYQLTDDLDGSVIDEGRGETVQFALDGNQFEIDLRNTNATALRDALAPYIAVARPIGGRKRVTAAKSAPSRSVQELAAIREWARANGHQVSDRGRISASVVVAYESARG
jgi:hypothetical protein